MLCVCKRACNEYLCGIIKSIIDVRPPFPSNYDLPSDFVPISIIYNEIDANRNTVG